MDLAVEQQVWHLMQTYFPAEMDDVLESALASYRRLPGYAASSRLHAEQVGAEGLQALIRALTKRPHSHADTGASEYVHLRLPLRVHLSRHLHVYLIQQARATEPLLEAYLAQEVGL